MKSVEIYTGNFCGYCTRAKRLLSQKGVNFIEYPVGRDPGKRAEMVQRSRGGRTVPQIFIDGRHVGGYDELYALDRAGKLDPILAA
jgi:glutaredoxin 3